MSINEILFAALSAFGDPVQFGGEYLPEHDGDPLPVRYYLFSTYTMGASYADDAPEAERCLVTVHFYCPRQWNSLERVEQTKQALYDAGLTWPDVQDVSDRNGQHWVFENEVELGVVPDG